MEWADLDDDGFYHAVKVAWRAMAQLQVLLEAERNLPVSEGARPPVFDEPHFTHMEEAMTRLVGGKL